MAPTVADPGAGAWIAPRLAPFGTCVGAVVPQGFQAYARVLHPVLADDGAWATWADVAERVGTTAGPHSRYWRLAGWSSWQSHDGPLRNVEPVEGNLAEHSFEALAEVLAGHTAGGPEAPAVSAVWSGWGWLHGGGAWTASWRADGDPMPVRRPPLPEPPFGPEVVHGPQLELPAREYLTFDCTLATAHQTGRHDQWQRGDRAGWQSPNLLWPADRTWCLATEIDLQSTYVGGPAELIAAILADERLETFPADPADPVSG